MANRNGKDEDAIGQELLAEMDELPDAVRDALARYRIVPEELGRLAVTIQRELDEVSDSDSEELRKASSRLQTQGTRAQQLVCRLLVLSGQLAGWAWPLEALEKAAGGQDG